MTVRRCKGKKLPRILTLLVIASLCLAVVALLPAVSADSADITILYGVDPDEITIGDTTTVTLEVCNIGNETKENVYIYYVLPKDVEYNQTLITPPPDYIIADTLIWNVESLDNESCWNASFELDPEGIGEVPLNMVPYSRVTYRNITDPDKGDLTTSGITGKKEEVNITSYDDPDIKMNAEFEVIRNPGGKIVGSKINFDDKTADITLCSESIDTLVVSGNIATFWGNATVNDVSGYQFILHAQDNGEGPIKNDTFRISITGPDGFEYTAAGYIGSGGGNIQTPKHSSECKQIRLLTVFVYAPITNSLNISALGGKFIAERVDINGYWNYSFNGTKKVNVTIYVDIDGFQLKQWPELVAEPGGGNITVSTRWYPMSSGVHALSVQVHGLKDDGRTEFWTEAQGPNTNTTSKTIYIKKVKE